MKNKELSQANESLNNQTEEMKGERVGINVYKRLASIWENLGFSPFQKLAMASKYSENTEESNKLTEALDCWEQTNSCVDNYNNIYKSFKEFLSIKCGTKEQREASLLDFENNLDKAENALLACQRMLITKFNDTLFMNHKNIRDLIEERRIKLKSLKEENL